MIGDMQDMVVPDVMNDVYLPKGRYPENFMLVFQLEVCLEGDTWRTLRVPERRHG